MFSWDDIPGNDNKRLIGFLKKRFNIEWADNAKIEKFDDGKTIRVNFENNFLSLKLNDDETKVILEINDGRTDEFIAETKYFFSWDRIPGNDNVKLIEFLKKNFGIDWAKTAEIEKIDNGNTIKVSTEIHHLSLNLNQERTEVIIKIDDGRTDKFIAEMKNGKLNIYEN